MRGALGHFSKEGSTYLITRPTETLRPWANFCFNDRFYINVDQFGRGMSQVQNGEGEWAIPVMAWDEYFFSGEKGIYIRDEATGHFWDAGWAFTQREFTSYESEMAPGSVRLRHEHEGIRGEWLIFVDAKEPVECWELSLSNAGDTERKLSIYPFQLAALSGFSVPAGTGAGRSDSYTRAQIDREHHAVVCRNMAPFIQFDRYNLLLASDVKPMAYESIAEAFLGLGRQFGHPAALKRPILSDREAAGQQMLAALQIPITLAPGETRTIRVIAAAVGRPEKEISEVTRKYFGPGGWEAAVEATAKRQRETRAAVAMETPDAYVNALANFWLPQQVSLCARFSRGWGQGYRDSLQDARATCLLEAPREVGGPGFAMTRRILEGCLRTQYATGGTPRKWSPLSHENYSDGPAWLIDAVVDYVRASADTAFLDAMYPFLEGEEAPVHEHVRRAAAHMLGDRGAHGLVRIREGDWNDGITGAGKGGEGESVFNTQLLLGNLERMGDLSRWLGSNVAKLAWMELVAKAGEVREALDRNAWDGKYYLRAYDDHAQSLGSHTNDRASMYLEPQAFALLSGSANANQAGALIASVEERLETPYGCRLLAPSYDAFDPNVGRVSAHVVGMWENGAVYCHATAFYIHGLCRYGQYDKAFDLFLRLTGGNPQHPSEASGVEPYAMTNCFAGPENPSQPGVSRAYWFTGTAGWCLRYLHEVLPNIVPDVDGVRFGPPCFPAHWNAVTVNRIIRGRRYEVRYTRQVGADREVSAPTATIQADGTELRDGWLPDVTAHAVNRIDIRFS